MRTIKFMAAAFAVSAVISIVICSKVFADENMVTIGAAPPDPAPVREELDMVISRDLQEHIWEIACGRFPKDREKQKEYFAALIGLADGESTFNPNAYNDSNSNGTVDRGLFQINSSNIWKLKAAGLIEYASDLYDPMKAADCGDFMYWTSYEKHGWSRRSYDGYLYGDAKEHDNKYTRRVWEIQKEWYRVLWP